MSPPARRRGSKRYRGSRPPPWRWSPPARRRGSKRAGRAFLHAPDGRLLRGGVDRNNQSSVLFSPIYRRLLRGGVDRNSRSEEHTSELQSLMRISYAVFCLKTK